MNTKELLTRLCCSIGTPGRESDAVNTASEILQPMGKVEHTALGSIICRLNPWIEGRKVVMLEAHIDQVGLVVSSLSGEGFIRVASCGGIDSRILPGCPFIVHTKKGPVPAVGVSVPPHLQSGDSAGKPQKIEDMLLDTFLSGDQAEKTITPGDIITYDFPPAELVGGLFAAPALDNRAGCASVILSGQILGGKDYGVNVVLLLASMEEVGGQGARTASHSIMPDLSIAVDVTYGMSPGMPENKCFKLGSGAQIGIAPILNRKLTGTLADIAEGMSLPYGYEVMGGNTGTDADQIAVARCGVPTALLSIPLRNMHSPSEIVDMKDVETTAKLMAEFIKGGAIC